MKRSAILLFILLSAFVLAAPAQAVSTDGFKYGAGLQGMTNHWGASFTWDVGPRGRTSLQPILLLNNDIGPAFRLRHAFWTPRWLDAYGGAFVGVHSDLFFGGMIGIDWDWRGIDRQLPPINWSIELDLEVDENSNNFGLGVGVHYVFGR